jgi:hypothetical protein
MRDTRLAAYVDMAGRRRLRHTAWTLVADALERIEQAAPAGSGRALALLALRRYLRIQNLELRDLASLWSWTAEQMQESATVAGGLGRRLLDEASRVQAAFARANPGYTLAISPPRDLERQVSLWAGNASVRSVADRLRRDASSFVSEAEFELPPTLRPLDRFCDWLQASLVNPEPGNAAPGTSSHGRMQAVDFIVMQGARVIAGTQVATIPAAWVAPGWARRLADAVVGTQLVGPLAHPYEPWHWSLA